MLTLHLMNAILSVAGIQSWARQKTNPLVDLLKKRLDISQHRYPFASLNLFYATDPYDYGKVTHLYLLPAALSKRIRPIYVIFA